jgi:hypothetical protein
MKKAPRLTPLILLPVFAILGSTWGVQFAHAATISAFTGSWQLATDQGAFRDKQGFITLVGPIGSNFTGNFFFRPSISNYSDDHVCSPGFVDCENWSGTFSGGSVAFAAYNSLAVYTFTGTITGGSFSGGISCDPFDHDCLGENDETLSFTSAIWEQTTLESTGPNGWRSQGTFSGGNTIIEVVNGAGPSIGTLSMTTVTTTPEPGSTTLMGSGILAVAGFLRRRLRNRSRC